MNWHSIVRVNGAFLVNATVFSIRIFLCAFGALFGCAVFPASNRWTSASSSTGTIDTTVEAGELWTPVRARSWTHARKAEGPARSPCLSDPSVLSERPPSLTLCTPLHKPRGLATGRQYLQ